MVMDGHNIRGDIHIRYPFRRERSLEGKAALVPEYYRLPGTDIETHVHLDGRSFSVL